jgi:hypothetical protein
VLTTGRSGQADGLTEYLDSCSFDKLRKKAERRALVRRTFLLCVTAFAVNGLTFLRLKRDFTFLSAFCTGCFKHLAWSKIFSWAAFAKISHDFSPNLHNKKVFRTLIQGGKYNQITSHYQEDFLK